MEKDNMTQAELIIFLETLAENVEFKAETGKEAAEISREKIKQLKEGNRLPGLRNHKGSLKSKMAVRACHLTVSIITVQSR